MRKPFLALLLTLLLALSASALAEYRFTDATGAEVALPETPRRTVALISSFGDVWLEAGGSLVGATDDAFAENGLRLSERGIAPAEITSVGSTQKPNIELILAVDPDFVILSDNTAAHLEARPTLEAAGIPCGVFSMMTYREYLDLLRLFAEINQRPDLYEAQLATVLEPIEAIVARAEQNPEYGRHTALLLRASSTKVHAKDSASTVAGPILKDMGLVNIADSDAGLLENLSMEAIIAQDPDYIFMVYQGSDDAAAAEAVDAALKSNPAFATLSAVQNDRYIVLDRALFHFRPNARWAEAYQFIEDLVYGAQR